MTLQHTCTALCIVDVVCSQPRQALTCPYVRVAQAALAARLGTTVTAHDMPGFGLTQRCVDSSSMHRTTVSIAQLQARACRACVAWRQATILSNICCLTCSRVNDASAYTLDCNGRLGRAVMDSELWAEASDSSSSGIGVGLNMLGRCGAVASLSLLLLCDYRPLVLQGRWVCRSAVWRN